MLRLHHVFVCAAVGGLEAEALLEAGLVEGTRNTHAGQGTANRRFFFERGMLELIWVHDREEAQSERAGPTRLWERWNGRGHSTNPFGICFTSVAGTEAGLPFPTRVYQPAYLPGDRSILFADTMPLTEPEVFALSWPLDQASPRSEPTEHPLGLRELQSVSIGLPDPARVSATLGQIRDAGLVGLHSSADPELIIRFSADAKVKLDIPALGLSMSGQPGV